MKRETVNICYRKHGNEYYIFMGNHPYAFGSIYDKVFFNILTDEQKNYIELNKYCQNYIVHKLKLSNKQFIEVVTAISPCFRQFFAYEAAFNKAQKIKQHENNTINP